MGENMNSSDRELWGIIADKTMEKSERIGLLISLLYEKKRLENINGLRPIT